ncbi:MAG: DUF3500 domain-containing protein [Planctomycetaceae bacterium]
MTKKSISLNFCAVLLLFTSTVPVGAQTEANTHDQSVNVTAAAEALLQTLSDGQRAAVLFKFNDAEQRVRWSNLPTGIYQRRGLRTGDLKPDQLQAVFAVIQATLSPAGWQQIVDNVAGDEVLHKNSGGRPGRVIFGKDEYYFSILGAPSRTEPWMWQFGGHHLAINATIIGDHITLAPSLTGGQPMRYVKDEKQIVQMADEVKLAFELVNSLNDEQKKKAVLEDQFADLALGPGRDDVHPAPAGIRADELTEQQHVLLKKLLAQRIGLLNEEDAAERQQAIEAQLAETWFSWHGPTSSGSAAYYRIQGPRVFMEYSPQQLGGSPQDHIHAMYREFENDYGLEWLNEK